MKVSHNWLKAYVPHDLSPQELADALTMSGLEVEDVTPVGSPLAGVVVGEVLEVRSHPNADRLRVCSVALGGDEPVQIVCGAANVAQGQRVPVATVGTTLLLPSREHPERREPVTIRAAKLRGEASSGMICAEDELGLSDDHSGIMVLAEDAPVGTAFGEYLRSLGTELEDHVLDVSITPNRPDATSHVGIARDVSVLSNTAFALPSVSLPATGGEAARQVAVEIEESAREACPRYVAMLIRGVTVGESPAWLKRRLTAIGLRPRNNVVDVSNYVMFECGQPLHAFDFDEIAGGRIRVRLTGEEMSFTTLDGNARTVPGGTLMICDAEREVAIAGIMGGENSEVSEKTTDVLLESAYFDPSTIRRAARALGLQTDASYRFERGIDREGQLWAAARAAALIAELTGGTVVDGAVDAQALPYEPRIVSLRPARVSSLLGTEIPLEEIFRILRSIGFEVTEEDPLSVAAERALEGRGLEVQPGEVTLRCVVPSFRPDVEREVDLIEEVARLYGYDRIPEPLVTHLPRTAPQELPADVLRRNARALLVGAGYREIQTNSMLRLETARRFNVPRLSGLDEGGEVVETLNPISTEMSSLRPSLLPGLLQVMGYNQNHGQRQLRFYEWGHVFRRTQRAGTTIPGYAEYESFILATSGPRSRGGWDTAEREGDFFDLKGEVTLLLEALRVPNVTMTPEYTETPITAYHLDVRSGSTFLGVIARLSEGAGDAFDLRQPVFFAELDWHTLVALAAPHVRRRYRPIGRHPVVERDVAVVVDEGQAIGPLLEAIREAAGELLHAVGVFDLYVGDRIGAGKKSVAFSLRFGADRTLRDEEVDARVRKVVRALADQFGAELRG